MQQFITSSEACALLDRILQTVQSLKLATAEVIQRTSPPAPQPVLPPAIVEEPTVLPLDERPIAPVLTIKLSDLIRESTAAKERRQQRQVPRLQKRAPDEPAPLLLHARPRPQRPLRPIRQVREVEVVYRRNYRLVS
jgi:hypothetical protein